VSVPIASLGIFYNFEARRSARYVFCGVCFCGGCSNTAHFRPPVSTEVEQAAEGGSPTLFRGRVCGWWVWGASFQGWPNHRAHSALFCGTFTLLFSELLKHPVRACRKSCPLPGPRIGYARGSEWEPRHLDPSRLAHASRLIAPGNFPHPPKCGPGAFHDACARRLRLSAG